MLDFPPTSTSRSYSEKKSFEFGSTYYFQWRVVWVLGRLGGVTAALCGVFGPVTAAGRTRRHRSGRELVSNGRHPRQSRVPDTGARESPSGASVADRRPREPQRAADTPRRDSVSPDRRTVSDDRSDRAGGQWHHVGRNELRCRAIWPVAAALPGPPRPSGTNGSSCVCKTLGCRL